MIVLEEQQNFDNVVLIQLWIVHTGIVTTHWKAIMHILPTSFSSDTIALDSWKTLNQWYIE